MRLIPAIYAHEYFGKKVKELLDTKYFDLIESAPNAYLVGLQGPDLFFFYHPWKSSAIRQLGINIHYESAMHFFTLAADVIKEDPSPTKQSYLLGFFCHYMLDSTCHPAVTRLIQETGIQHMEIESELDRFLMLQTGKDPLRFDPAKNFPVCKSLAEEIQPFYPTASSKQIYHSLRDFKRYHQLLAPKNAIQRNFLYGAMRCIGVYKKYHGLVMHPAENPLCKESTAELYDLLCKSVVPCIQEINAFFEQSVPFGIFGERLIPNFE